MTFSTCTLFLSKLNSDFILTFFCHDCFYIFNETLIQFVLLTSFLFLTFNWKYFAVLYKLVSIFYFYTSLNKILHLCYNILYRIEIITNVCIAKTFFCRISRPLLKRFSRSRSELLLQRTTVQLQLSQAICHAFCAFCSVNFN